MIAALDFGDLVKFAVFFFVVVLPILRTIHEAVKARRAEADARDARGGGAIEVEEEVDEEDAARRAWEALMRGESPAQAAPAPPPPPPAAPEAVSRRVERGRAGDLGREALDTEPAAELEERYETRGDEAVSSEGESYEREIAARGEEQLDEEAIAVAENQRRIDDERARREAFLRSERESAAGRRESVAADAMTSFDLERKTKQDPSAAVVPARTARPRALRTRDDLRRGVLAAEILGRPAALRERADGPVGLR